MYREHRPCLRLPRIAKAVLEAVHGSWRTAIVTNGPPDVQARKVEALGVSALVDVVVLAESCGTGRGKPEPAVFMQALDAVGVRPRRSHGWRRSRGATWRVPAQLVIQTIRVRRGRLRKAMDATGAGPDAVVTTLAVVPAVAERLLQERLQMPISIAQRQAGGDGPLFVIAELGLNHGGSLDEALILVDAAAAAGASAIKLQTLAR